MSELELKINHHVHQLMQLLEVQPDPLNGISEDLIAEKLVKSTNQPSKNIVKYLMKLEAHSNHGFKQIYEELKAQNIIEIDALVQLLARISDHDFTKNLLRFHKIVAGQRVESTSKEKEFVTPPPRVNNGQSRGNAPSRESRVSSLANGRSTATKGKSDKRVDLSFLTYDYTPHDWTNEIVTPLSELSITQQQNALIEELLYVLVGIEGRYIRRVKISDRKYRLVVNDEADKLLKTLVERIITISPLYSTVTFFVENHDHGLVNQALVAFMREILKDYFLLITQLESQYRMGEMTLQGMWYFLQEVYSNFEILKQVCLKIRQGHAIGGAVLSILHEKTIALAGNIRASQFCQRMTSAACEPYFQILEKWISEGIIIDEHKEFFIEDTGKQDLTMSIVSAPDDSYWENRYEIVSIRMPIFLSRFADKIMRTGKYLAVIRECGKEIGDSPECEPLVYTIEDRVYAERIDTAYNYASKNLLRLLQEESDLMAHFASFKHYFFMDKGDFIVSFMDIAENELQKEIDDIVPTRLESLLGLAVKTSVMNTDPHADLLGIELLGDSVLCQLSQIINDCSASFMENLEPQSDQGATLRGFEALTFKYRIEWPLSLIINQRNIACYQILFRHLFYFKYVERHLESIWNESKCSKRFSLKSFPAYAQAFACRQKMLNFVQNLEYYMMVEVIEPNFHTFTQKVNSKVNSVDDMINEHTIFMEGCLQDCMLTQKTALRLIVKLLHLCMEFCEFMQKTVGFSRESIEKHISSTKFAEKIQKIHEDFNKNLYELLKEIINQQSDLYSQKMLHILYRLDFNGYYMKEESGSAYN